MNNRSLSTLAVFLGSIGLLVWGCQSSQPVMPSKNIALSVYLPPTSEIKASLLGVASNELLYHVDAPGLPASGAQTVGPFSTAASGGSINFTANVPAKDNMVLSLQLNDASTHQPLAVGATGLDMVSSPVTDVTIEMGSVTRNCYFVNEKMNLYGGFSNLGSTYAFSSDALVNGASIGSGDIAMSIVGLTGYLMVDAQGSSTGARSDIAYLGNGDFVTHDMRPPDSNFFPNSGTAKQYAASTGFAPAAATTQVQAGDVYCVLTSVPYPNYYSTAWVQITDPGFPSTITSYGPSFRFRTNSTLPYFAYERTPADLDEVIIPGVPAVTCSSSW